MIRRVALVLAGFLFITGSLAFACSTCVDGPAVISFFKAECNACLKEMPELDKLHAMSDGRFKVIGVSLDDQAAYEKFTKSGKVKYPTTRYADWESKDKYPSAKYAKHIPSIIYVGKQGKVHGLAMGWFNAETMEEQIEPLVDN